MATRWWKAWLARERPDLLPRFAELYGTRTYAPKAYQDAVTASVRRLAAAHGVGREQVGRWRTGHEHQPVPAAAAAPGQHADQLSLL